MNLFINTLSKSSCLILFNEKREIISQNFFDIKGNESSKLIGYIEDFLETEGYSYFDVEHIVVVNGPGSFTGIRTTILVVNTINFITKKQITPLHFFELYSNYPIIKSSSKRDSFFKETKESEIQILPNEEILTLLKEKNISNIYGNSELENLNIFENIDYSGIIQKIELKNHTRVDPFYLKKPNIC